VGLAKAVKLAMLSLEDGTIDRVATLRDRLEAGLLRIPGTGVHGSQPEQSPHSPMNCHPERAQRVEGPAFAFSNSTTGAPGPAFGTRESMNPVPRVANTTNIWFDDLEGEALVIALDLKGVAVSGGSACHSGATEPSHVLLAMGVVKNLARASLRFSLLKTATEADVDYVLQIVPQAVENLRAISPVAAGTAG